MKLLRNYRIVVPALVLVVGSSIVALSQFGANDSKAILAIPSEPKIVALNDINAHEIKQELPSINSSDMDSSNPMQQIQFLRELLNESPDDEMALMGLGNASLMIRRFDDAASLYERLLEVNPKHLEARTNLASIRLEQGNAEQARSLLEKNLEISSNHAPSLFNLGVVYLELGDHPQAVNSWKQWLVANPGSSFAGEIKRRIDELEMGS